MLPGVSSRRDYIYLEKSVDLPDRLLGAFESASGVPYASIDLRSQRGIPSHDGGASSMAEAATVQMEMKYLAQLTGKEDYWRKAEKLMQVFDDNVVEDGLLPIFVSPETGRFTTREIRMGSRGDSYYGPYCSTHHTLTFVGLTHTYQNISSSNFIKREKQSTWKCGNELSQVFKTR